MKKVIYVALATFTIACSSNTNTNSTAANDSTATEQTASKAEFFGDSITLDSAI